MDPPAGMLEKGSPVRARPSLAALLVALAALGATTTASAYERQWRAGGGLGYVGFKRGDFTGSSLGAELDLTYGLSDMFNLLAEVSVSPLYLTGPGPSIPAAKAGDPPTQGDDVTLPDKYALTTATVGVAYTLDVLRWVPYAGLLVGYGRFSQADGQGTFAAIAGKKGAESRFDTVLAVGLDYQITREWGTGLALRLHAMPGKDETQAAFQGWLRLAYSWGW